MKSEEDKKYWEKRAKERLISAEQKALRFEESFKKSFEKVKSNIESEIANLYFKFADENGLDFGTVKSRLSPKEKDEFRKKMRDEYDKATTSEVKRRIKAYYSNGFDRLSAKKANLKAQVDRFYSEELYGELQLTLEDAYNESYYRAIYDGAIAAGFFIEFDRVSQNTLKTLLEYPWSGKNYSEKIWGRVQNFSEKLENVLTVGIIEGASNQEMARNLARVCDGEYKNAIRLIRTETNFVANEGAAKAYESQGVESYEYLAALDLRTSEICREMDGKVFALKDKVTGKNYPPLHPHCRSTTVPYILDLEGTRIARGHDGKTYKVDRHMNYKDWYDKYVRTNPKELLKEKQIKNESKDKAQYAKYKEKLGKNAPKSLAEFIDIKYNKDRWELLKGYTRAIQKGDISTSTSFKYYEKMDAEITKAFKGVTTANGIKIKGHGLHFIDRIIGNEDTYINKKGKLIKKRDPVKISDALEAILNPDKIGDVKFNEKGKPSVVFVKRNYAMVSVNPETQKLVQTNKH